MSRLIARFTMGATFLEMLVPAEKLTLTEIGNWLVEQCRGMGVTDNYMATADCRVSPEFLMRASCTKYCILKAHPATLPVETEAGVITTEFLKDLTERLQDVSSQLEASTARLRKRSKSWAQVARLTSHAWGKEGEMP